MNDLSKLNMYLESDELMNSFHLIEKDELSENFKFLTESCILLEDEGTAKIAKPSFWESLKKFFSDIKVRLKDIRDKFIQNSKSEFERNNSFLNENKDAILAIKESDKQFKVIPYWNSQNTWDKITVPKFDPNNYANYKNGNAVIGQVSSKISSKEPVNSTNFKSILIKTLEGGEPTDIDINTIIKEIPNMFNYCNKEYQSIYSRIKMDEVEIDRCTNESIQIIANMIRTQTNKTVNESMNLLLEQDDSANAVPSSDITEIQQLNPAHMPNQETPKPADNQTAEPTNKPNNKQKPEDNQTNKPNPETSDNDEKLNREKISAYKDYSIYAGYILSAKMAVAQDKYNTYLKILKQLVNYNPDEKGSKKEYLSLIEQNTDEKDKYDIDPDSQTIPKDDGTLKDNIPRRNRYIKQGAIAISNKISKNKLSKEQILELFKTDISKDFVDLLKGNTELWKKHGQKLVVALTSKIKSDGSNSLDKDIIEFCKKIISIFKTEPKD